MNGLSKFLRLTVRQNGKVHFLEFAKGVPQNGESVIVDGVETRPMKVIGETDKRGTEVHFLPDPRSSKRTTTTTTTSSPSACASCPS